MLIGVPKEIKTHEYRIGMTPSAVREAVHNGHKVLVQKDGAARIGFDDENYRAAGAEIIDTAEEIFARAEMIVKVKEPQANEWKMLREGQLLFTYLHLAPDPEQARGLMESGCVAIAYETVTDDRGGLPLLAPMSEVAGRMAIQAGAHSLEITQGGRGMLLGGVPGVAAAEVVILGGGVVGTNAARMAMGLEAKVTVLDKSLRRLNELDMQFGPQLNTIFATVDAIEEYVRTADLVIGAVLIPGAAAPKLLHRDDLATMKRGAVLVDVAIDQGGCFETSRPTTHADPTYVIDDVVHYCVANMPGGVARTSTQALNNATLPFTLKLANKGYRAALASDPHLRNGLNVAFGKLTYEAVAGALGETYVPPEEALRNGGSQRVP
ncbi:alanine dehydrogenase [Oceanibacterium hippocampi]|uniref:Alanine dehydrogenase n=1 Tax=Oceanibacterium hippocampi TaxID=745714 RepID=A0A1Y5RCL6_9PROT|nr:alanine dehydrogenase [Oceanibacterium hippocampi]SLN11784.1 Alanine dehydrogenase [Oceanibacterium hippocampi]